jgi:hypothetical protein
MFNVHVLINGIKKLLFAKDIKIKHHVLQHHIRGHVFQGTHGGSLSTVVWREHAQTAYFIWRPMITRSALRRCIGFSQGPANHPVLNGRRLLHIEQFTGSGSSVHLANSFSGETSQPTLVAALCVVSWYEVRHKKSVKVCAAAVKRLMVCRQIFSCVPV